MIVGDSGVGKTAVVNALVNEVEGLAMSRSESTNYVDIFFKKLKIKDGAILINMNIWDFNGKLNEPKIRQEFYAESHAIVYMFDVSNLVSFNNIENWLKECKKNGGDKMTPVLVGNKSDLKKEVTPFMIEGVTEKFKMNYFEISCKDLSSIKKFFSEFANSVFDLRPKERTR